MPHHSYRVARDHIVERELMKLEQRAAVRRSAADARYSQRDLVVASLLRRPDSREAGRDPGTGFAA